MDLAEEIAAFLRRNPEYRSWERLPEEPLERSRNLDDEAAVQVALELWRQGDHRCRWAAVTLVRSHPTASRALRWRPLEAMGDQMAHWGDVDVFASLAGPAWREGRISDARVRRWAGSPNRWWRRAALVCTVFLNRPSVGGRGDTERTLGIARMLAADRDDMVVKGMSWALRELIRVDREAVDTFLEEQDDVLAARVKREVRNKLTTGLKNPRGKSIPHRDERR